MRILLIDSSEEVKQLLLENLTPIDPSGHSVFLIRPVAKKKEIQDRIPKADVTIIGSKMRESSVLRLASFIRSEERNIPIFALTEQREAGLPQRFKKAGVDAVLSIHELKTPLLSWTLISALKHAEIRKKAAEFEVLQGQISSLSDSLASITHEINNPLSVMRLALYHLQSYKLDNDRRGMLMKLIGENIDKVQVQTDELRAVRVRIGAKMDHKSYSITHKPLVSSAKS